MTLENVAFFCVLRSQHRLAINRYGPFSFVSALNMRRTFFLHLAGKDRVPASFLSRIPERE